MIWGWFGCLEVGWFGVNVACFVHALDLFRPKRGFVQRMWSLAFERKGSLESKLS